MAEWRNGGGMVIELRNGGMVVWWYSGIAEWRNGGMVIEWRNGGMVIEWWNGGMAEWRNGGMAEWRNGSRMAEWFCTMSALAIENQNILVNNIVDSWHHHT